MDLRKNAGADEKGEKLQRKGGFHERFERGGESVKLAGTVQQS